MTAETALQFLVAGIIAALVTAAVIFDLRSTPPLNDRVHGHHEHCHCRPLRRSHDVARQGTTKATGIHAFERRDLSDGDVRPDDGHDRSRSGGSDGQVDHMAREVAGEQQDRDDGREHSCGGRL